MKFSEKFNKVAFSVDTTDMTYCKLSELYNSNALATVYRLDAIFINKSQLGESPLFIVGELGKMVNMPSYLVPTCRDILADVDAVQAIKAGAVGFTVYEYESHARKCYGVRFVDIDTDGNGK